MTKRDEKREKILDAAAVAFYTHGYSAANIDEITKTVGCSKRTIYNEFSNKEGIFKELIISNTNQVIKVLEKQKFESESLKDNLEKFGFLLMNSYMKPKMVGVFKVILNESTRFPELGKIFFENGPKKGGKILENIFKNSSELDVEDSSYEKYSDYFIGMLRSNIHLKVLLGLESVPNEAELKKYVNGAVKIFLDGIKASK